MSANKAGAAVRRPIAREIQERERVVGLRSIIKLKIENYELGNCLYGVNQGFFVALMREKTYGGVKEV